MKLHIAADRNQPDPFIFEDGGRFYLYVTASEGVECYRAADPFGEWEFLGAVASVAGGHSYWAPSVILLEGTYYMYVSCQKGENFQFLHVLSAKSPTGPFREERCLFDHFSIDSHAVLTRDGLYLWYAKDNLEREKRGTRIYVDKMLDPLTPEYRPAEMVLPDFDEEKFTPQCDENGDWYTVEGPFWFQKDGWQYVMYSAGCYQDDTYHIGYAAAKSDEGDLRKVPFVKHTEDGHFAPTLIKNGVEEGTGHHSVLYYKGEYYAVYHGRDLRPEKDEGYVERRTARICKLHVGDGVITAERI